VALPYRLLIGDLRTGEITAELPGEAEFTDELPAPGSARATIPIDAVPAEINLRTVTAPWRHYLAIATDDTVLWAGPILPRTRRPDADQVEISASGLWAVFNRRVLARRGDWDYTDERADVILTYRSVPGIALDIVDVALNRPHGELPLVLPRIDRSGDQERRYFGYELATAGERLKQLTDADNGPDLHFLPRFQTGRDAIEWTLRVGLPLLSQPGADWHFDDGGQLVAYGWDEDGSVMADTVLVPGDGLDTVVSTHGSEKQRQVLDAHARAYLDAYRTGITRDTAIVRTDTDPRLGSYHVGDRVVLTPRGDRATPPGQRHRRITAITYRASSPNTAELALAPAPSTA
jgi:hypothetical protein